jgi:large subunit ribosomal protein L21
MTDYAVIRIGSRQYKVSPGSEILIPFRETTVGTGVTFDQVLLMVQDGSVHLGYPTLAGMVIKGTVVGQEKGEKLKIAKFKAKARYQKESGFRPKYTRIKVGEFLAKKEVTTVKPAVKKVKNVRQTTSRTKRK